MRPGTRPAGSTNRRGRRRRRWARSRAGQAAGAGRPGGGSGASPSAARSRRTAWGSVTAPRIRRRPPQRSHTSTSRPNTRWSSRAQGQRLGERDAEVGEHAARVHDGAGAVGRRLVPDRRQAEHVPRVAGAERADDHVVLLGSILHGDQVVAHAADQAEPADRLGRVGQQRGFELGIDPGLGDDAGTDVGAGLGLVVFDDEVEDRGINASPSPSESSPEHAPAAGARTAQNRDPARRGRVSHAHNLARLSFPRAPFSRGTWKEVLGRRDPANVSGGSDRRPWIEPGRGLLPQIRRAPRQTVARGGRPRNLAATGRARRRATVSPSVRGGPARTYLPSAPPDTPAIRGARVPFLEGTCSIYSRVPGPPDGIENGCPRRDRVTMDDGVSRRSDRLRRSLRRSLGIAAPSPSLRGTN